MAGKPVYPRATSRDPKLFRLAFVERNYDRRRAEFAKAVSLSIGFINKITSGRESCRLEIAQRIALGLDKSVEELFTIEREAPPSPPRRRRASPQLELPTTKPGSSEAAA